MIIRELLEQKSDKVAEARELINKAEREKRDLTSAEQKKYNDLFEEVARLEGRIKVEEEQREAVTRQETYKPDDRILHGFDQVQQAGRALEPSESFRSLIEGRGGFDKEIANVTPGQFLRSLVMGPKNEAEQRLLLGASDSAGGYFVPEILSSSFIDALRAQSVMIRAGARTLPVDANTVFATVESDPTPAWRGEGTSVAESDPSFGALAVRPKTLGVITKVSRELLDDGVNIEQALTNSISKALAIELDRACLVGEGAPIEPTGLTGWDINEVAHNAAPDYDSLLEARTENLTDNAPEPNAIILHPRDEGVYSLLKDGEGLPLPMPPKLQNIQWLTTTSMPITQGTGTDSTILIGNFRHAIIALRSDIRIEVLKELYMDELCYGFVAWLRADFAPEYENAFCKITGVAAN